MYLKSDEGVKLGRESRSLVLSAEEKFLSAQSTQRTDQLLLAISSARSGDIDAPYEIVVIVKLNSIRRSVRRNIEIRLQEWTNAIMRL
jgi:hypothetical protein